VIFWQLLDNVHRRAGNRRARLARLMRHTSTSGARLGLLLALLFEPACEAPSTSTSDATGSADYSCDAPALPACEPSSCSDRWAYRCDDCETFVGGGDCFSYSQGCSDPLLTCDLPRPCSRVWAIPGLDTLETLEDEAAAICVLEALRDGVPGEYEIIWGEMSDQGWISEQVFAGGDGRVVTQWRYDCPGCFNFGAVGQTGVLPLELPSFFDDCLTNPTAASLIGCLVGPPDLPGILPPDGYLPPFVVPTCDSLTPACP
jgi:hypothetical protein